MTNIGRKNKPKANCHFTESESSIPLSMPNMFDLYTEHKRKVVSVLNEYKLKIFCPILLEIYIYLKKNVFFLLLLLSFYASQECETLNLHKNVFKPYSTKTKCYKFKHIYIMYVSIYCVLNTQAFKLLPHVCLYKTQFGAEHQFGSCDSIVDQDVNVTIEKDSPYILWWFTTWSKNNTNIEMNYIYTIHPCDFSQSNHMINFLPNILKV